MAGNFFDAAILISTGSLFYANLIWFGLLVIIGIALIRTVDIIRGNNCITRAVNAIPHDLRNLLCGRKGSQGSADHYRK